MRETQNSACGASWRTPTHQVTDRAKRYRANAPDCCPTGARKCALCRSPRFVVVDHKDGNKSNGSRRNLRWLCKSCNTRHGLAMARAGKGKRTRQFNPGARTLAKYTEAILQHRRGQFDAGGKIIHETPKEKRREFASEIWRLRRIHGTDRKPNPNKKTSTAKAKPRKKNSFGLDRFIGRKPRVTAVDWSRAGDARRAQALKAAGVSKKLTPSYVGMSWSDLQQLDPGFVTKVMKGLARSKNSRVRLKPRKRRAARAISPTKGTASKKRNGAIADKVKQYRERGLTQQQAVKAAMRQVSRGHTKRAGKYKKSGRRNPRNNPNGQSVERAKATYAMFHGRGPSKEAEVAEFAGDPKILAALGDLVSLGIGPNKYSIQWGGEEKRPFLATDKDARQLYIVGGNQDMSLTLAAIGVKTKHDLVDLGMVGKIEYLTQKSFDSLVPTIYYHFFGEEDAKKMPPHKVRRPRLIYSRRLKKLMLAGGAYKIKEEGIVN